MVLKRKRSDSEISTSSSLLSSPLSSANYMSIDSHSSNQLRISTPSLFSSRTKKRHRDNRPSEEEVHQHTLSILFSAQRNPPAEAPRPIQPQEPVCLLPSDPNSSRQSSLHSFWTIPSARQMSPSSNSSISSVNTPSAGPEINSFFKASNCEDCNASLSSPGDSDAMDVDTMMDIDTDGGNHACTICGKQVCHSCAVSNLGSERKCLNCTEKKKVWVGGLGWVIQN